MLVNSKEILLEAKRQRRGVPAPDFIDMDSARAYVKTAQAVGKPIILSFAQVHSTILSLEEAAMIGKFAASMVDVPIALHLDHGLDEGFIKKAIELGFTSVMIDASMECFEENVRRTKSVVDYAHERGITVEAEIGHVGQGSNYTDYQNSDSVYTTVEEAVSFAELTGADSLAVSIGTAHGAYRGNGTPVLNFERLSELADAVPVPLVLHGSSGSGDENLSRCVSGGITKVNIFTDFLLGAMKNIEKRRPEDYLELKKAADEGMAGVLSHYFEIFASRGEK
ncbi:ketose-bisphosphate aldolase [Clostridium sp. MCC353]|uniref:class II fructose-bisphosphate aldolase n=1 Tax=Clostridium sp. MCC353 TaxID=2592646 RepID=UPI001C01B736|nr:class II fructose-bisphosphate aldolase [Clostridium sp. MCC353]MBT9779557.1 ketose-bisphosphate aldolase [Clostridium sp. MCC353]